MISLLTVNYLSAADVAGLARSLLEHHGGEAVELVVVNNSPAQPVALPPEARALATVLERNNIGYGRGINAAAAAARGDVWMIVNPDVRLTAGALPAARGYLFANPDVGVLLPQLRGANGARQPSVRRFYTWPTALYARFPLRDLLPHPPFFRRYLMLDDDLSRPTDVDWGLGGAMFVRPAALPGGYLFDERFFLYFEDVDLCLRTWRDGRRVVYHPGIVCVHAHRRHSRRLLSTHAAHHLASFARFALKYRGLPQRPE